MTIEFGDSDSVDVARVGPVIGSEFAQISVNFDTSGNSPRLRLEDLRSGRVRYLDALELETIIWLLGRAADRSDRSIRRALARRYVRRAAIVCPVRTAVGTFGGSLRPLRAEDLAARAITAVVERSGIDPAAIEDVVFAQSYANSEAPCIGRWAALHADLPISVPGSADRPALRWRATGRRHRGDDGADWCRRRRAGRRCRVDEQYRALHHDRAVGLAVRQPDAVRPARPWSRIVAADLAIRPDQRHDRDRRKPGRRLRDRS